MFGRAFLVDTTRRGVSGTAESRTPRTRGYVKTPLAELVRVRVFIELTRPSTTSQGQYPNVLALIGAASAELASP
jgi:hypothetical protein